MSAARGAMSGTLQPREQEAAATVPAGTAGRSAGAPEATTVTTDRLAAGAAPSRQIRSDYTNLELDSLQECVQTVTAAA